MEIPTLKIRKKEDLKLLNEQDAFHLEVYIHNSTIEIQEVKGSLIVRAKNCTFPNLTEVNGNLSVDAKENVFRKLKIVKGNLNIHEKAINLPELEVVLGKLKMLHKTPLNNLSIVNGIKINDAQEGWIEIQKPSELNKIPNYQYCNIRIKNLSLFKSRELVFEIEEHFGSIEIINTNCYFPNLRKIWGDFFIEENTNRKVRTPKLEVIYKKCVINSSNQVINVSHIKGKLFIKKGTNNLFPILKEVEKLTLSRDGSELIAPQLKSIRKQSVLLGSFKAVSLEVLNVDYDYKYNHYLPNLKQINGTLKKPGSVEKLYFKKLEIINGDFELSKAIETPNIQHVYGRLILKEGVSKKFNQLKTIGELVGTRALKEVFVDSNPTIVQIKKSEYFNIENSQIVQNFYHTISENNRLSKTHFYIGSRWSSQYVPVPIEEFIRIIKMRHQSFQNFYTREVLREWDCELNEHFVFILHKIEKQWKQIVSYSYEQLFSINNLNIRRFSFNYVGVAQMMKALNARRVATKGILVDYYKYDLGGKKAKCQKHNIFETYQVDFNEIEDLKTWNSQKAYAVKCWCTSTNKEHWLWIEEQYKDKPLEAIASTFRVHENVIPYIKCLKRQGDILICEMKNEVIPQGSVRPLTKEEYFGLLVAES
ncbi:hypothetical protein P8625_04615 [Tenacibaculum tangerinum]|uniref:Uncharacterized protein n=1 Tax=Tenacibaculum tangerinum TaxID=3038772 RepID=A0ABY8L4V5_9FLAO|nr:hypothetical protein [Tenacibaculum tangerinum]WGH76448.1 hypothetical protein P8625_04615 [Tenacibaculum tangerinum]